MNTASTLHFGDDIVVDAAHQVVSVINQRDSQQDVAVTGRHLCAIADGMGGHADGAAAANAALDALQAVVNSPVELDQLVAAVIEANNAVVALSDGGWRNPGTTLVAVVADPDGTRVNGIWVGDSRAYLIGADGTIDTLTTDHAYPFGGLSRCLGDHGRDTNSTPGTFQVAAGAGNRILMCTDGVSGPLDDISEDDDIYVELLDGGLEHLVRHAAANGSDNATAVLVDVDQLAAGS